MEQSLRTEKNDGMLAGLRRSNFFTRLTNWEYWPFGIIQLPAILYYLFVSIKHRSLVFFSASNPGIVMGGMFGESKFEVLNKLSQEYVPKTILLRKSVDVNSVMTSLEEDSLKFPVIFKPDIGERGFMVNKICNLADVSRYLNDLRADFIAQELVSLPMEFGVFYVRYPNDEHGQVTSVVGKEMLTITGDGQSTIRALIHAKPRAKLQWEKLKIKFHGRLDEILPAGAVLELVSIGNHALGTKFLNCNYLINAHLSETFDIISKPIEGFYFGRFDLRCASVEDLYAGRVKVLELNGCGAEPAHIYQPGFSLFTAMRTLVRHWHTISVIAAQNRKRGFPYTSHSDAIKYYRKFKSATKP